MGALVLEGGTFRPIFSCGVMDALLDNNVEFPYVTGVSAGISNGFSYVSKQRERSRDVIINHRHDKRYIGVRNYFTDRSLFGIKFVFETASNELYPFDWDTFYKNPAKVVVGVTNAQTGKPEYLDGKQIDRSCTMLKATCAIPLVFPVIKLNGKEYYDGALCDPIPAKKAEEDGNEKMLIVLTRAEGCKKTLSKINYWAARIYKNKYPDLVKVLLTQHEVYNEQVKYCEKLERDGKAFILRPSHDTQIDAFEKDIDKMKRIYQYGYDIATENIDKIREYSK